MPAKWYICPDSERVLITECLEKCRMGDRCMSLPALRIISKERPTPDKVSASQANVGIREMTLKALHDYAVDPFSMVFALFGTATHLRLEGSTEGEMLAEVSLQNDWTSGTLDLYDAQSKTLTDFKTWGSYKVAKALGLEKKMVPDPTGERYKRSGRGYKAGDIKMVPEFTRNPDAVDMYEVELQLNAYRMLLNEQGFKVNEMHVEAIVRDGGTHLAASRGVDKTLYHIPVRFMDDDLVREFYTKKTMALREALATGHAPDYCTIKERWEGRKCEKYCQVADICKPPWLEGDKT